MTTKFLWHLYQFPPVLRPTQPPPFISIPDGSKYPGRTSGQSSQSRWRAVCLNKGVPQLSPGHYSHLGHQTLWTGPMQWRALDCIVTTIFLEAQHGHFHFKKWIFRSGFCQIFHSFMSFYFNAESPVDSALIFMQCQLPAITEPGAGGWGPKTAATLDICPTQNNSWRKQTQLSWQQQPCACVPRRAWNEGCRRLPEVLNHGEGPY